MTTTATTQLPHRRQSFTTLRDDDVHRLAGSVLGAVAADDARIERPEPGVDNRTYLIRTDDGGPGGAPSRCALSRRGRCRQRVAATVYTQQFCGPIPSRDTDTRQRPTALLDEVRPACWRFTWLDSARCLRTLLHNGQRALVLEERLAQLARRFGELLSRSQQRMMRFR